MLRRIALGVTVALVACVPCVSRADTKWIWQDWMAEAGIGGGISRVFTETSATGSQDGASMRYTISKGLRGPLLIGFETAGVLREGGGPDSLGAHFDTFLVDQVGTLRWIPWGFSRGSGALHIRAGIGRGQAKVQHTAADDTRTQVIERGTAILVGAGYMFRLGKQVSIGMDLTYSHLGIDGATVDHAKFLSSTFVVQWHSWSVAEPSR